MLIDWFTVGAQALNFLVLVWLMKRFAYQPILDAIDARERRIAAALADADALEAKARAERDAFERRNEAFEQQRAALLAEATQAAAAERERLLAEARQAADALAARRRETLRADLRRQGDALARRARQEVFAIARSALADLAGASLEERIAEAFVQRLRALDDPARRTLRDALAAGPALVHSAFELPAAQRAAIESAVRDTLGAGGALRFETAPDLVAGIELRADGQAVAWSIAGWLASLQQGVDELAAGAPAADEPGRG